MSRTRPSPLERRGLEHRCGTCDSLPHEWCATARGVPMSHLHGPRYMAGLISHAAPTSPDSDEEQAHE